MGVIDVEGVKAVCVCVKGVMWDGVQRCEGGVAEVWGQRGDSMGPAWERH